MTPAQNPKQIAFEAPGTSGRALGRLWKGSRVIWGHLGLGTKNRNTLQLKYRSCVSLFNEMLLKIQSPSTINCNNKRSPVETCGRGTNQGLSITTARTLLSSKLRSRESMRLCIKDERQDPRTLAHRRPSNKDNGRHAPTQRRLARSQGTHDTHENKRRNATDVLVTEQTCRTNPPRPPTLIA